MTSPRPRSDSSSALRSRRQSDLNEIFECASRRGCFVDSFGGVLLVDPQPQQQVVENHEKSHVHAVSSRPPTPTTTIPQSLEKIRSSSPSLVSSLAAPFPRTTPGVEELKSEMKLVLEMTPATTTTATTTIGMVPNLSSSTGSLNVFPSSVLSSEPASAGCGRGKENVTAPLPTSSSSSSSVVQMRKMKDHLRDFPFSPQQGEQQQDTSSSASHSSLSRPSSSAATTTTFSSSSRGQRTTRPQFSSAIPPRAGAGLQGNTRTTVDSQDDLLLRLGEHPPEALLLSTNNALPSQQQAPRNVGCHPPPPPPLFLQKQQLAAHGRPDDQRQEATTTSTTAVDRSVPQVDDSQAAKLPAKTETVLRSSAPASTACSISTGIPSSLPKSRTHSTLWNLVSFMLFPLIYLCSSVMQILAFSVSPLMYLLRIMSSRTLQKAPVDEVPSNSVVTLVISKVPLRVASSVLSRLAHFFALPFVVNNEDDSFPVDNKAPTQSSPTVDGVSWRIALRVPCLFSIEVTNPTIDKVGDVPIISQRSGREDEEDGEEREVADRDVPDREQHSSTKSKLHRAVPLCVEEEEEEAAGMSARFEEWEMKLRSLSRQVLQQKEQLQKLEDQSRYTLRLVEGVNVILHSSAEPAKIEK